MQEDQALISTQELVERYFSLVTASNLEPYFAQFARDAVVEDEGREHRGIDEIRAWWSSTTPVSYRTKQTEIEERVATARAEITGDFPQSPVTLTFSFAFTDSGKIQALTIR